MLYYPQHYNLFSDVHRTNQQTLPGTDILAAVWYDIAVQYDIAVYSYTAVEYDIAVYSYTAVRYDIAVYG
jgi:hypothetical protein